MSGPTEAIELFHGYTYSGHPVACAAGMATLDIYESEGLLTRAATLAETWRDAIHTLRDVPIVTDIRTIGLVAGIEIEPRAGQPGGRGYDALVEALKRGLLIRTTGDIIALSPPLIVEREQIATIVDIMRDVLEPLA